MRNKESIRLVRDARCESLGTVAIKNAGEDEGADPFDDEVPHKSASSSSSIVPSNGPELDDFVVILGLTGCIKVFLGLTGCRRVYGWFSHSEETLIAVGISARMQRKTRMSSCGVSSWLRAVL